MLFWTAFGAIGTVLGSVFASAAIFISVKQLRQPLKRNIKIIYRIKETFPGDEDPLFILYLINDGLKMITLESVGYKVRNKYIQIQDVEIGKTRFPRSIKTEEIISLKFDFNKFRRGVQVGYDGCDLISFACRDITGKLYQTKQIEIARVYELYDKDISYDDIDLFDIG